MKEKKRVVKFVDAICGSGKSTTLQHYIKSSLLTNSEAIPPRFLLVMPTHELCGQVREELKDRRVKSFHVDTETEAVRHLISTLEYDFQHSVIICTHQCFIHYCYRAALETELQNLLRNFSIFVDEIPDAMFGAYIKVQHTKRTEQNFPFLDWLEERDGLLFLSEDKREDFYDYWHETEANGAELKRLLWAIMQGAGLLYEENKHLFAFTASPIIRSVEWAEQLTLLGAGSSRSLFVWAAEHLTKYEVEKAGEDLQPPLERRKHKRVPISLVAVCENRCTLTALQKVFHEHLQEIIQRVPGEFIFATNRDKSLCQFTTIGDEILTDASRGIRVSIASYGLNHYQHIHNAVFLGCSNLDKDFQGKWRQYAELNGWNVEEFEQKQRSAMNYERCYQFISRTSIRNADTDHPLVFVVPDLATAEYIKEHYFPGAKIECLKFGKVRKKVKGNNTRKEVQEHKSKGLTQRQTAELMKKGIATIQRHWN
ncbi:hypothetical protein BRU68_003404 [Escherichia coli]|nr:hypothetical protein [Escherichia coli]EFK1804346.1 hypothetical protein [Escherichia coli]HDQ6781911.1 hypothetical protein [Escherichia coli O113:H4]HDQ6783817.1 hypothetical protein [Escherichia coli O113:H4]HDQ6890993.1 hypothetical protein [Escherichia coli O113:H4]